MKMLSQFDGANVVISQCKTFGVVDWRKHFSLLMADDFAISLLEFE